MTCWRSVLPAVVSVAVLVGVGGCGGDSDSQTGPQEALIVVSPHPDDESIFGAATIQRLAADPNRYVRAIYMSSGDRSSVPGDCKGIPEARKIQLIIARREKETHAAWRVLAPHRDVPIDFLRGPDMGLVASSMLVDGLHVDTLSPDGQSAVNRAVEIATRLPPSVRSVLFLTTAIYDAHPDHRTAYRAARQAAELLRNQRQVDVRIWSWIVHDEQTGLITSGCCPGDLHWPSAGTTDNYFALIDFPARPRPPMWNHVEDVSALTAVRHEALAQHVSQVVGYPALCMPVYIPAFYTRWMQKVEEPFYEQVL